MKRYIFALGTVIFLIILASLAESTVQEIPDTQERKTEEYSKKQEPTLYAGAATWLEQNLSEEEKQELIEAFTLEEHQVYSFLQGPRSWGEGIPWSGEWCLFDINGNSFGNFGCGLCCMANIYNTLSSYEVSPWDMCEYAMTVSGYAPGRKIGAIDWGNMKETLKTCGISCDVYHKPKTYEEFQKQMAEAKSAVVLVSSYEDDTFWKDTPGHYVNIWLYQEESDTVFLAEPGSPENNRTRISLRYVYDALKTTSKFQYLAVDGYTEEDNQWKADGIDESWNHP